MLNKRRADIKGGQSKKKIKLECFNPFNIDRKQLQPIRFSFGVVKPKEGTKSSAVEEYSMNAFPHGTALIINNEQFERHAKRIGTSIDERNLIHVFRFLGYKVEVHRDLQADEMLEVMEEMGQRSHADADSFICCILSHGKEGQILATDEVMLSLDDLVKKVDASHCPSLADKPKLFFFTGSRGAMKEHSVRLGTNAEDKPSPPKGFTYCISQTIGSANFFFGYASALGYVAWRDIDNGSWYVSELCRALAELSTHASLSDIMTQVHLKVGTDYENLGYKMSPEITSRLQKNVFF